MTKEQYLDMCEMMNTEPIPEEIPIEYDELPTEVQEALSVYNMLQDNWDTMNGIYMGKIYAGILETFKIMGIEDERTIYFILTLIDRQRSEILNAKHRRKAAR